ncbi:MAG: IS256 family transposase [Opitutales bacterium]|nr:IS256 family transposase [Opitutales bacterium]
MKDINEKTPKSTVTPSTEESSNEVVRIDFNNLKRDLSGFVRGTVEEALNGMLDAEAQSICGAGRYERTTERQAHRSGSYERNLETGAGKVRLKMPKLRGATFETQIIERYRRREASVEESLVQMYLAGVSVRRVEDITEALWGTRVSPSTVSDLNQKIYERIEQWRDRPLRSRYVYVYMDGLWLKRSWGGEVENVSILVAIGVNEHGFREVIGASEGMSEDKESWKNLLTELYRRGVREIDLVISDKASGLVESLPEVYPASKWQRCVFHFHKNILHRVPLAKREEVAAMLKAVHAQEDAASAREKAESVVLKLQAMRLSAAGKILAEGIEETLTYYRYPREHHRSIRTNNMLERIMKEIRRRTRVVGSFPDGKSALMLACARLRYIASKSWSDTRVYLDMKRLEQQEREKAS